MRAMRSVGITLALFAALTAAVVALYIHTARALDRSVQGIGHVMRTVADSVKFSVENVDPWSPVLWNGDTIGKVIAIGRTGYGSSPEHSVLIYRALLTGRAPPYQPDSLAAIDSSDDARFAHELRLIPLHAVGDRPRRLGTLAFEHTNAGIPVMAAAAPCATSRPARLRPCQP